MKPIFKDDKLYALGAGHESGFFGNTSFSATLLPKGERANCFINNKPVSPEEYAKLIKGFEE